jgi:hypothetical protein
MAVTRRFALCLVASLAAAARDKPKKGVAAILEISVRRSAEERVISVEGRVANSGAKPIAGLTLVFRILAPSGEEVSRQRGAVEQDPLDPGEESEFHWQMKDHARAVEVRIEAVSHDGFDVTVEKPGPYTIE